MILWDKDALFAHTSDTVVCYTAAATAAAAAVAAGACMQHTPLDTHTVYVHETSGRVTPQTQPKKYPGRPVDATSPTT